MDGLLSLNASFEHSYEGVESDSDFPCNSSVMVLEYERPKISLVELTDDEDDYNNYGPCSTDLQIFKEMPKGKEINCTETKSGCIKEYLEKDGLGILLSKECGLVLFHVDTCRSRKS